MFALTVSRQPKLFSNVEVQNWLKMNRADFQDISRIRVVEARALLNLGYHQGAYYLIGYAVECALKAGVAKRVKQHDFPDRDLANAVFTHDLEALVRVAGLTEDLDKEQEVKSIS